jgi:hypothetical protein
MARIPRWLRLAVSRRRGVKKGNCSFFLLKGKSLLVTPPDGDYMDRFLGCGPAGLRQSRGPLGKCFTDSELFPAPARAGRIYLSTDGL